MNLIEELEEFINQSKDAKEIKRALAVKMALLGESYQKIQDTLACISSFY